MRSIWVSLGLWALVGCAFSFSVRAEPDFPALDPEMVDQLGRESPSSDSVEAGSDGAAELSDSSPKEAPSPAGHDYWLHSGSASGAARYSATREGTQTSEARFRGFEKDDDVPAIATWTLSTSYSSLSPGEECAGCGRATGPGISLSYGARSPVEYTGLGVIAGYRQTTDGSHFESQEFLLGIDSIAYLTSTPGKPGGMFLRGVIGAGYTSSRYLQEPVVAGGTVSGSSSGGGTGGGSGEYRPGGDGDGEIRSNRVMAVTERTAAAGSGPRVTEETALVAVGRIGAGYEFSVFGAAHGLGCVSYEHTYGGRRGGSGVVAEVGVSF